MSRDLRLPARLPTMPGAGGAIHVWRSDDLRITARVGGEGVFLRASPGAVADGAGVSRTVASHAPRWSVETETTDGGTRDVPALLVEGPSSPRVGEVLLYPTLAAPQPVVLYAHVRDRGAIAAAAGGTAGVILRWGAADGTAPCLTLAVVEADDAAALQATHTTTDGSVSATVALPAVIASTPLEVLLELGADGRVRAGAASDFATAAWSAWSTPLALAAAWSTPLINVGSLSGLSPAALAWRARVILPVGAAALSLAMLRRLR